MKHEKPEIETTAGTTNIHECDVIVHTKDDPIIRLFEGGGKLYDSYKHVEFNFVITTEFFHKIRNKDKTAEKEMLQAIRNMGVI